MLTKEINLWKSSDVGLRSDRDESDSQQSNTSSELVIGKECHSHEEAYDCYQGYAKIMDFGTAKISSHAQKHMAILLMPSLLALNME